MSNYYASSAYSLTMGVEQDMPENSANLDPSVLEFNVTNMQTEIMTNGPIITGLSVFTDFYYYPANGNIYSLANTLIVDGKNVPINYEGGHAVLIIGWDQTVINGQTVKYWICQNSWGTSWGLNGFFYIEMGVNMVNIEFDAVAVKPDMTKAPLLASLQNVPGSNLNSDSTTGNDVIATTQVTPLSLTIYIVIGVVAGIVILLLAIFLIVFFAVRNARRKKANMTNQTEKKNETINYLKFI